MLIALILRAVAVPRVCLCCLCLLCVSGHGELLQVVNFKSGFSRTGPSDMDLTSGVFRLVLDY